MNGNDSELEYLSSGEESVDVEHNDYGGDIVNSDTKHTDGDSISDDNSSSENGGSANPKSQSNKKKTFRWRKRDMMPADSTYEQVENDIEETKSPLEYFKQFWPDEIHDLVVEQSNLYSTQKSGTSINTSTNKIEKFIGMHIKMGIIRLPSYKLYWSQ